MADEFECPDCQTPFVSIPSKCGCGWINPSIQRRAEAASVQNQETIYQAMPDIRRQAQARVDAAKERHGDQWRDKLMSELKSEMRHAAMLGRRQQRQFEKADQDRLRQFRKETSGDPETSIYYSLENFQAHVASLRASGVQVTIISENQEIAK